MVIYFFLLWCILQNFENKDQLLVERKKKRNIKMVDNYCVLKFVKNQYLANYIRRYEL